MSLHNFIMLFSITFYLCHEFANDLLIYFYVITNKIIKKIKKRAINKANEISVLIERYKNIETKLINTKCDRNNTINLWFDCLTDLKNII